MIYVPPLHAELMSTTALTPTHHKSAVRTVATIAVAIAIPAVAPSIATSIGLSTALGGGVLGSTLGSAVVGTALGALAAKVTGQPVLQGALGGAFVGGVGGFADAGGFSGLFGGPPTGAAAVSPLPNIPTAQLAGAPITTGQGLISGGQGFAGLGVSPGAVGAAAPGGFTLGAAPSTTFNPITESFVYNPGGGGGSPVAPLGSTLGGGGGPEVIQASFPTVRPPIGGVPQPGVSSGINLGGGGTSAPRPGYWSDPIGQLRSAAQTAAPASGAVRPLVAPGAPGGFQLSPVLNAAGTQIAPPPQTSFLADLGKNVTAGVKKAFDPANLAQKGVEAAGQLGLSKAAEYFADDVPEEMSPDEEAFLRQQRAQQGRLLGEQEKIALQLANEARSVPVSGQAESNRAKIAAARAGQTYIRQGSQAPAAVAARRRQVALAAARRGGTAQIQGRTGGLARRADFLTAAAGTLPTGQELASGAAADLAAADKAFLRREKALQEQRQNFAAVFGGLLPAGEDTDKEIEEAQARRT